MVTSSEVGLSVPLQRTSVTEKQQRAGMEHRQRHGGSLANPVAIYVAAPIARRTGTRRKTALRGDADAGQHGVG